MPGPWATARAATEALSSRGIRAQEAGHEPTTDADVLVDLIEDDALAEAFAFGPDGPLPDEVRARIAAQPCAALIEVVGRLDERSRETAKIGRALRDAGGAAVRMEASGGASPWPAWLSRLEAGEPFGLYTAAVTLGTDGEGTYFTRGMHHFDLADAELWTDEDREAAHWLGAFCTFQIEEQPALGSGHTFRPDAEHAPRVLERWPDHRHHPDDGRHNPFGRWRILPEGERGLEAIDPVPTIMPSLVALLHASEQRAGRPLTQSEVEALVDGCPAIAMELRHTIALERARGYADIEPRRAWAHWQIVRQTL